MKSIADRYAEELAAAATFQKLVGPYADAILVKGTEGYFAVPVEDMYVGRSLRFTGKWEQAALAMLRGQCRADTRLLVVGAHVGALAIPLARVCRHVTAVEANPQTLELLKLNVLINGITNCRVLHKAASNREETIDFLLARTNSGGSKRVPLIKDPALMALIDDNQVTKVEAAPLDGLLPHETFDVIVMDIEGSEYFALQGMQRILGSASILQVEFLPFLLRDVAGASVVDFVATIAPHFSSLIVPQRRVVIGREQFTSLLSDMYDRGECDPGLLFLKATPDKVRLQ